MNLENLTMIIIIKKANPRDCSSSLNLFSSSVASRAHYWLFQMHVKPTVIHDLASAWIVSHSCKAPGCSSVIGSLHVHTVNSHIPLPFSFLWWKHPLLSARLHVGTISTWKGFRTSKTLLHPRHILNLDALCTAVREPKMSLTSQKLCFMRELGLNNWFPALHSRRCQTQEV